MVGSVGVAGATVGRIVMFGAVDVAGLPELTPGFTDLNGCGRPMESMSGS